MTLYSTTNSLHFNHCRKYLKNAFNNFDQKKKTKSPINLDDDDVLDYYDAISEYFETFHHTYSTSVNYNLEKSSTRSRRRRLN